VDNQSRSYRFTYDRANRLSSAISGAGEDNFSIPRVSYDANGNISFLSRMAKVPSGSGTLTTKIDSLDYQYLNGGNQLRSVTDNAIRASLGGFRNGTNSGDDYEYYADGKLRKDLNRNITLIQYNYLDLVSKIKFANNDSIQYFYSSLGEKRRTERTIGGQKSYTFYDGEIIYSATSISSLNDYRVWEIQNPEGRYVNGKLEYGYTDHLGNLRLSYKDSLGRAFITQSYAYDAWGLELKLLRYQFSTTNNDRYTWQGKEDLEADNLEGWSDFGWRIEDRTLGRWFTPDPEDQFQNMTTYGYCANNPVSHIDPDGRIVPILIPVIAGIVGGGLNLASNWSKINGDPLKALGYFASGAVGGVVSLSNPLAGGAITSTSNAAIDIVSGNVPQIKNFGDVVKYVGQEAAWGTATSLVGSQVGKVIGPQIAKLGKSVGGWFRNTFQAYAKESLQTVIINGEPVTTTIDVGIKATKQYVAKSLGGVLGNGVNNVENVVATKSITVYRSVSLEEYQDILLNGFKPGENSYATGKLFADKLSDAKMYAKAFDNSIIMKAKIPAGVTFEKLYGVDGLKYIYNVPSGSLRRVKVLTSFKF
ncbi:MAG: hypothetical protein MUE72_14340, partial [Chitinophagaceae bacterium]|nr:hypothetical protein [Chitinophagaceae bacterium]